MSVRRVYVGEKPGFRVEATGLLKDLRDNLYMKQLEEVRILHRYDVDNLSDSVYEQAIERILSEAPVDDVFLEEIPEDAKDLKSFAVEYLPGQFDQRADSAAQCVQMIAQCDRPTVRSAHVYLLSGNDPALAASQLHLSEARLQCAQATLRQLGLWQEEKAVHIAAGERPTYSEQDVLRAMDTDVDFRGLYGEIQRVLGRTLNTEELKILLGFVRYLGLPADVISVLVCYCKERARQKGNLRNPSLRTIEKEAYYWAERGIDSLEEAAAFIQTQNMRSSRLSQLMEQLQIRGRALTAAEEKYASSWLDMGFADDVIAAAYERTCLNTGGLNWAYMNKILQRWHEQGLHTAEEVRTGDRKPVPKGASGQLGDAELEAIQKLMR